MEYEYKPVPVEQLADYLNTSEGHEFTFHPPTLVRNAICELYAIKTGGAKEPVSERERSAKQTSPVEAGLLDTSVRFLMAAASGSKNCDGFYRDPDGDASVAVFEIAERLGLVECVGNRRWSLTKSVIDEIEAVYTRCAEQIVAAAGDEGEPS